MDAAAVDASRQAASQVKRLGEEGYELTEAGRKAVEAIVQAVVEQIR
jgi:hypothetical protein